MKNETEFDCIEMKEEIQAKHLREYEGLSDPEIEDLRDKKLQAHPVLGPLFRNPTAKAEPSG